MATHSQGEGTDTQVLSEQNVSWLSLNSEASSTPAPYVDGENLTLKADAVKGVGTFCMGEKPRDPHGKPL